ncbi:MAG: 2-C-methyl-D-erythritol 4-phosphate cytidylyltransferase [Verrucomicrobia subdivision 3 bacterium]|nr:2-C-methyl-D-erythritol 4-phosphate cytidylyltransferase [Limisphaerales bacterium]
MVSAVIVAAGSGTRMGVDKLFLEVAGLPIVGHTWRRFDAHPAIDEIVLVIRENSRAEFEALGKRLPLNKPFSFVIGGDERQDSVSNGLGAVHANCELVAIQDGARPCTPNEAITTTISAAQKGGAAVSANKVVDTIKEADGTGRIARNVDRTYLWAVQTPQLFKVDVLRKAMAAVRAQDAQITDDTSACELIGQPVTLVDCGAPNPKVTTVGDLLLVEMLLRQ